MIVAINVPWISPKVHIKESLIGGKGLFASEQIKRGERVLTWGGDYVNKHEAKSARLNGKLVMQWDDDLFSVEDRGDDDTYFVNHSCDPNLWMNDTFTLTARKDVDIGEELTADYAMWESDEKYTLMWECKCGTVLCRGKVSGRDWENPDLQERYQDHFSPLINKRIESGNTFSGGSTLPANPLHDYS